VLAFKRTVSLQFHHSFPDCCARCLSTLKPNLSGER
jgi:hypothetical protein